MLLMEEKMWFSSFVIVDTERPLSFLFWYVFIWQLTYRINNKYDGF